MAQERDTNVARIDDTGRLTVERESLRDEWSDGTKLKDASVERIDGEWHLAVRGETGDGNCHALFIPVDFTPEGAVRVASRANEADAVNTCTGDPCSSCKFSGGRCSCDGPTGRCNHTITTLSEVPEFLTILKE